MSDEVSREPLSLQPDTIVTKERIMSAAEIREETSNVDDNVKNRIKMRYESSILRKTHFNSEGVNETLMYYSQGLNLITK